MEGGQEYGSPDNRGREGYGRQEKRGQETGFPGWWGLGENEKFLQLFVIFCNNKIAQRGGTTKERGGN